MRRIAPVALAFLVIALLAAPAADAAASGARTPAQVSCDPASSNCAVQDVAMVASTSPQCSTSLSPTPSGAPCRFAAGTLDGPRIGLTGPASAPTWTLWNQDGSTRTSGGADPTGCPTTGPQNPTEDCDTDVTDIALSATGTRIAVAARLDMNSFLVQVFDDTGALKAYHALPDTHIVNDLAIDPAGSRVAVGVTVNPTAGADTGAVHLLSASANTAVWNAFVTGNPVTTVDLTNSVLVAGAGNEHLRFHVPATTHYANAAIQGAIMDVDAATHASGWSVVGHGSGFFAVYSSHQETGGKQNPSVPDYQKREAGETTSANAAAIRDDATMFAVGHEGGRLRLYSLDPASAPEATVALVAEKANLGGIDELQFSADGRYLVMRAGDNVRLYFTGNNALDEMWTDTRAGFGAPGAVAIDGRGEHVVAALAESAVVYDAIHRIQATIGTATQLAGSDHTYQVQYRNDGNRAEALTVVANPPTGVTGDTQPSQITLLPGATGTVAVEVDIPATWPPGTLRIPVRAALNAGTDGTEVDNLDINVPITHKVVFEADGADSLGANNGGPAVFEVIARNEGNVVEDIELSVSGLSGGWTAEITPPELSLDPGETARVSVALQPPPGLANGARIDVQLTHDGVAPMPLALTATVGAVFQVKLTAPVGTIVNPGVTAVVNLTVRNDGNTRDSAVVQINALPSGWLGGFINGQSELDVQDLEPCATDPGSCSRVVQMTLRAPVDYDSSVPVQVTLVATSVGDEAQQSTARLLVTVQTAASTNTTTDDDGGNGIPGPTPFLVMAALALAASVARRRTQ